MADEPFSLGEPDNGIVGTIEPGGEFGNSPDFGGSSDGGDDFTFDADRHIDPGKRNADGSYRRKRKRKSAGGTTTSNRSQKGSRSQANIDGLTGVLLVVCAGLASVTKTPELEIDEGEGEKLARSYSTLMNEFNFQPNEKIAAIVGAVITTGYVFGPRMYLISERLKAERAKPVNRDPDFINVS